MRTELRLAALAALLVLGACGGGADEAAAADSAEQADMARIDSMRKARLARDSAKAADSAAAPAGPSAAQQTLQAKTEARQQEVAQERAAQRSAMTDSAAAVAADQARADSVAAATDTRMQRETFAYGGGTRDPFASALKRKQVGPELADLTLVGVLEDPRAPSRSVATFRDKRTSKRYSVKQGDMLGRARVVQIRGKDVLFSVLDFGVERRETLTLRKVEDVTP